MTRPTREQSLMESAVVWSKRSTCSRLHVGCVIHRDGRILVQGYNGAPAGLDHCDHNCDCGLPGVKAEYGGTWAHASHCLSQQPCSRAVHAEQNAISFAARWGVGLEGAQMSVTHQPCVSCAMSIINSGITKVWFWQPYRLMDGLNLLVEAGLRVERMLDFEMTA